MNCLYCSDKTNLKNGDIEGHIGMTEIAFCIDCYPLVAGWILHLENLTEEGVKGKYNYEPSIEN